MKAIEEIIRSMKEERAEQPSLGAEMKGWFREGREDAWNNLIPAFPATSPVREQGAPGSPVPQQTYQDLMGKDVDPVMDIPQADVEAEMARARGNEQSRGR